MSKGLEALEEIKGAYVDLPLDDGLSVCTAITKEYKKELDIVEKELKALEIIKGLRNDKYSTIEIYGNDIVMNVYLTLDDNEIDLLKEVFENDI